MNTNVLAARSSGPGCERPIAGTALARAPGKVVLSGAYAVLEGAPALVAAVNRYVVADASRCATFTTPEVREALGGAAAPWFDASALRAGGRKLGLGSSAAIVVASVAAIELARDPKASADQLASRIYQVVLAAHARAQPGGSGVDVAASVLGGVLAARRTGTTLHVAPVTLPPGVIVHVLATSRAASTQALLGECRAFAHRDPRGYARALAPQAEASESAHRAAMAGDAAAFVDALAAQGWALLALGRAVGIRIVTGEVADLMQAANRLGAAALPAGAGGGDVALWVARSKKCTPPPRPELSSLELAVGVPGVHPYREVTA